MNSITQSAENRQAAVKLARRRGASHAARMYGVSLSSIKRWCKRYDGTLQSLRNKSRRPHSHPERHTEAEEEILRDAFAKYERYGWDGVYSAACRNGYGRSYSGMIYACRRMGLAESSKKKKKRAACGKFPEVLMPGEKVQIDVKEVPYACLRGEIKRNGGRLYQFTAIDECTRLRYVHGYAEKTPETSVDFLMRTMSFFGFAIEIVQTDNGIEFTNKYIGTDRKNRFEKALSALNIKHKLIPTRTPWHNGKVERSHGGDQRYFYDWETFHNLDEFNAKLLRHLKWSNNKTMRVLGYISPMQKLRTCSLSPARF